MREKKQINVAIGHEVKSAREKASLTQEQLSELLDVSTQYISDLERGVVGLSVSTLKNICTVLNVTSDRLLFGSKSEKDVLAIFEKTALLSENQLALLSEMVEKYIEAVQ